MQTKLEAPPNTIKSDEHVTVFIPFFVEIPRYREQRQDVLEAAKKNGYLHLDLSFHTQSINWAQIVEQINIAQTEEVMKRVRIRQVGLTKDQAYEIVNQHSWYKSYCAVYFVEAKIKKDNINLPVSEASLSPGILSARREAYPSLRTGMELDSSNLVAIHLKEDRRYRSVLEKSLTFPQKCALTTTEPHLLFAPSTTGNKKKDFQYYLEGIMNNEQLSLTFLEGLFSFLVEPNDSAANYFIKTPEERLEKLIELGANKAFTDFLDQHCSSGETRSFLKNSLDDLGYLLTQLRTNPLGQNYIPSIEQLSDNLKTMMGDMVLQKPFVNRIVDSFSRFGFYFSRDTSEEVRINILKTLWNDENSSFREIMEKYEGERTKFLLKSLNKTAIDWKLNAKEALISSGLPKDIVGLIVPNQDLYFFKKAREQITGLTEDNKCQINKAR